MTVMESDPVKLLKKKGSKSLKIKKNKKEIPSTPHVQLKKPLKDKIPKEGLKSSKVKKNKEEIPATPKVQPEKPSKVKLAKNDGSKSSKVSKKNKEETTATPKVILWKKPLKVKLPYKKTVSSEVGKKKKKNKNALDSPHVKGTSYPKVKIPKKKKRGEGQVQVINPNLTEEERKERREKRKAFKKAKQKEKYNQLGKKEMKKLMEMVEEERIFIGKVLAYEIMLEEKRDRAIAFAKLNGEDAKFILSDNEEDDEEFNEDEIPIEKKSKAEVKAKKKESLFPDSDSKFDPVRHSKLQSLLKSKMEAMKTQNQEETIKKKIKDEEKKSAKRLRWEKHEEGLKSEAKEEEVEPEPVIPPKPKIVKTNGEFVYSHLASSNDGQKWKERKEKWKGKLTPTDLLKNVEKNAKKLEKLEKEGNVTQAAAIVSEQKWSAALKRAGGEKVKDDPILLKKTIKKQDKILKNKKKKWAERIERVEKQQEVRLKKRVANIQSRKDERKKKNRKVLRARGRIE